MQELINFKDQNLNLDYLTLNISNSVGRISEFAEIFFRYGFNSKVFYVATNESQTILEDKKLFHTLLNQPSELSSMSESNMASSCKGRLACFRKKTKSNPTRAIKENSTSASNIEKYCKNSIIAP